MIEERKMAEENLKKNGQKDGAEEKIKEARKEGIGKFLSTGRERYGAAGQAEIIKAR